MRESEISFKLRNLSHAYIAAGQDADDIIMAALCDNNACGTCKHCMKVAKKAHPDIINIIRQKDEHGKLKREIVVDQIRELKKDIYVLPNEAERKVYVINEADLMNANAQNAFLQMLEEPPSYVVFILKTSNPSALLPTVRSRCVLIRSNPEAVDFEHSEDAQAVFELAQEFVSALDDNLRLTKCMFRLDKLERENFADFIAYAQVELSRVLNKNPHNKKVALACDLLSNASAMSDLNISIGHISGMICSSLMG